MKKTLDIKFKIGDKFYYLGSEKDCEMEILSGSVDKIEMFNNYFRYVNEDKDVLINWFKNEDIDDEHEFKDGEPIGTCIFTSKDKAKNSNAYKHRLKYVLKHRIERDTQRLNDLLEEEGLCSFCGYVENNKHYCNECWNKKGE